MDETAPTDPRRAWPGRVAGALALVGPYRLLVGTDDPAEWAAGAVAALLAMAGVVAVSGELPPSAVRPAWALKIVGLIPRMFAEAVRVGLSALGAERPGGTFELVPVDPGGDDAESSGRRAVVIAGASLAPNSVVVTLDRERRVMLVHRLLPRGSSGGADDREWPL